MSMIRVKAVKFALTATFLLCVLTACAVKLAPEYDKAIVTGVTSVNQKMMELFAATASGVEAATYEKREGQYNAIIGILDALAIQTEVRPAPADSTAKSIVDKIFSRKANDNDNASSSECKNKAPTICALKRMSEGIVKMRDIDKKQGVTANESAIYKKMVVLDMDIALTYESLLER
ncbi:MAG TPA: hypothetical protein VLS94_12235 [Fusibacter sp.]|nr:hypothetical protein [Fusibacter sp.]